MKTWADIEELLKDAPRTDDHANCTPFGVEAHVSYPDEEIIKLMYDAIKQQFDAAKEQGKTIAVRVYPELVKRSEPNKDGIFLKDAYFRLAMI